MSDVQTEEENRLIAERRRKLTELRTAGPAFPNDFRRDALAEQLHGLYDKRSGESLEQEGVPVAVAGRMMEKRVMGKASFAKLQDMSGRIQLFLERDSVGEAVYRAFKGWDVGDIVGARGTLFKTRTGELSVRVTELRLLTKSLRPLPEKFHGLSDQETRYRRRYLDLIVNPDSRRVFLMRREIVKYIRQFFDSTGFIEVETPMLQSIPGGATARPFATHYNALQRDFYLRVAPELYLKRLVVGGFERVYEINRNFRNEGVSTRHNPEFTMLEFYQAYADYRDLMDLTESLMRGLVHSVTGGAKVTYQERVYDFDKAFLRMSLRAAVLQYNPDLDGARIDDMDYLRGVAERLHLDVQQGWGPGKLQTEIFEKTVEPNLLDPTFVTEYPVEVSPLARPNDDNAMVTDRFELFVAGREIANGFSELNDPEDQAERFRHQVAAKEAGDDEAMFYDADYVRALEYGMPPTAGEGIGIDRLVMLLTDSASIRDVLLFPHMRPES